MIDFPQVEVELWLKLCSYFFEGTNTLFVLDGCAASKDVKNRTGKLVSLGFSAHHAGISVWVPTSRSPALQNPSAKMWLRLLFYNPSAKTKKIILWSLRRRALFWRVQGTDSWTGKNKNFPIRYCPLLSLRNQFFLLVYTACLNRMRNNKLSTRSYITNQSPGPGTDHEYWFAFFFFTSDCCAMTGNQRPFSFQTATLQSF